MIINFLRKLKEGTEELNFGRDIIANWAQQYAENFKSDSMSVFDIGLGKGADLLNVQKKANGKKVILSGIENYPEYINIARKEGITVYPIDIENNTWPLPDQS